MGEPVKHRLQTVLRYALIAQTLLFGFVLTYWIPFYNAGSKASKALIDPGFACKIMMLMFLGVFLIHMGVVLSFTHIEDTYMIDQCGAAAAFVSEDIAPVRNPTEHLKNV